MNRNNDTLYMVLDKYKLTDPISAEDQQFILRSRKANLKIILRKHGKYSLFLWLALAIGFIFRNSGLKLSLIQSKVILVVTTASIAAGSSTGVYHGAKYVYKHVIMKENTQIEEQIDEGQVESPDQSINNTKQIINLQKQQTIIPINKTQNGKDQSETIKKNSTGSTIQKPVTIIPSL